MQYHGTGGLESWILNGFYVGTYPSMKYNYQLDSIFLKQMSEVKIKLFQVCRKVNRATSQKNP